MKLMSIKIKQKVTGLPNPLHLSAQQTYRATTVKPKKGKGSYNRKAFKKVEY